MYILINRPNKSKLRFSCLKVKLFTIPVVVSFGAHKPRTICPSRTAERTFTKQTRLDAHVLTGCVLHLHQRFLLLFTSPDMNGTVNNKNK